MGPEPPRFRESSLSAIRAVRLWPQSCETAAVFSEKASPFEPAPGFHELALIAYTSGTTGPSKGVMLSHAHAFTDAHA